LVCLNPLYCRSDFCVIHRGTASCSFLFWFCSFSRFPPDPAATAIVENVIYRTSFRLPPAGCFFLIRMTFFVQKQPVRNFLFGSVFALCPLFPSALHHEFPHRPCGIFRTSFCFFLFPLSFFPPTELRSAACAVFHSVNPSSSSITHCLLPGSFFSSFHSLDSWSVSLPFPESRSIPFSCLSSGSAVLCRILLSCSLPSNVLNLSSDTRSCLIRLATPSLTLGVFS